MSDESVKFSQSMLGKIVKVLLQCLEPAFTDIFKGEKLRFHAAARLGWILVSGRRRTV